MGPCLLSLRKEHTCVNYFQILTPFGARTGELCLKICLNGIQVIGGFPVKHVMHFVTCSNMHFVTCSNMHSALLLRTWLYLIILGCLTNTHAYRLFIHVSLMLYDTVIHVHLTRLRQ